MSDPKSNTNLPQDNSKHVDAKLQFLPQKREEIIHCEAKYK